LQIKEATDESFRILTCEIGKNLKISVATGMVCWEISCSSETETVSDGNVPNGNFNPDNRQLKFNRNNADNANSQNGFRLSMGVMVIWLLLINRAPFYLIQLLKC
jgi:hypothetical protein